MVLDERAAAPSVAEFLRQVRPRILSEWERSIRGAIPQPLTHPALLDHVPELVLAIASRLEQPGAPAPRLEQVTQKHTRVRLGLGFDLIAVVTEYAELRRCILRLWEGEVGARARPGEIERLNQAIDEAMLESVSRFTRTHQKILDALDRLSVLALDSDDLGGFFARLLAAFHADAEAVAVAALFLTSGEALRLTASVGFDPGALPSTGGPVFVRAVAAARHPMDAPRASGGDLVDEELRGLGLTAAYGVPLLHGTDLIGVAYVGSRAAPEFSGGDRQLVRALASRATTLVVRRTEQLERDRLDALAQDAIRARDEFISIASHELNNPLHALQLQVEILLRGRKSGPDESWARTKLLGIKRMVGRVVLLVGHLLDSSRIEAHQLELDREEVDLAALVLQIVAQHDEELERAGYHVRVDAPEPVTGWWDRLRLEQIVTNLLSNAMKYGERRPLELSVVAEQGVARLEVRDRGIGIAPDDQARIFERFERVAPRQTAPGLGLGLWIVRTVVEAMRGRITVTSTPGEGSAFTVLLPQDAPEAAASVASKEPR